MNKKAAIIAGVAIVGLIGAFALSGKNKSQETEVKGTEVVTVQDENGTIEVAKNPERVVTFDYGVLDILDNMGVEVVGLPQKSVPEYLSKYKADTYANVGSLKEPDFEAVNELKPDLIIISGRQADMYDKFAEIATTVYLSVDGSDYLNDFSRNLDVLGKIFDKEDFVKENLDNLTKQMEEVKAIAQEKNVNALTTMVSEGDLSVFSDKSRFGLIYNQLGVTNKDDKIEESNHGQQVTFEYLAEQNPEYIFVVDKGSATGGEGTAKALFDNDLIKSTDAYKNDKIVYLDSAAWYVVAGGLDSTQTMINNIKDAIK